MATILRNWLARRRIAISLIGFTSLILANIFVFKTVPHNPFELANPMVIGSLALLTLGLAIRSWSAGTLMKSRQLTTSGPYAVVRNPLYVGSFMMMLGFCLLCRDIPTTVFVFGPMALLYWVQVQFEEIRLAKLFPDTWQQYRQATPRFIPSKLQRLSLRGWSWREWMDNREYKAVSASVVGILGIYAWYLFCMGQAT